MPTPFEDNFDRLLGIHRLSARKAAELLGISPTTLSYWRNGKRQPDTDSLMRVVAFFLIDPWTLIMSPIREVLPHLAMPERFEIVEEWIAEGRTVDQLFAEGYALPYYMPEIENAVASLAGKVSGDVQKARKLQPVPGESSEDS